MTKSSLLAEMDLPVGVDDMWLSMLWLKDGLCHCKEEIAVRTVGTYLIRSLPKTPYLLNDLHVPSQSPALAPPGTAEQVLAGDVDVVISCVRFFREWQWEEETKLELEG
ncbi:hypothetical protein BDQ17DRAFT_1330302 [Cyathus striatus]|nr:hypothetical protein BDQ17DRAFT_1330302 [Cyathus striatus]